MILKLVAMAQVVMDNKVSVQKKMIESKAGSLSVLNRGDNPADSTTKGQRVRGIAMKRRSVAEDSSTDHKRLLFRLSANKV
jgi:hypothetical protein